MLVGFARSYCYSVNIDFVTINDAGELFLPFYGSMNLFVSDWYYYSANLRLKERLGFFGLRFCYYSSYSYFKIQIVYLK